VALGGYLAVHVTQHVIGTHFHFGEETHAVSEAVSVAALVGLLLHTFVDGVAVASGLDVGGAVGALVFIAVILHKVPEGLAISSLFLAAGQGRRRAFLAAAALGASTILGVVLTSQVAPLRDHGLALAAGVTLYVGMSNLVPEFRARGGWRPSVAFLAGTGVYFAARVLAGG
jgi:ZIP family zinc transporter/zinc and cadmium transporter